MKYCFNCLQPDTRPGEKFDSNGMCVGCRNYYSSSEVNFYNRYEILNQIIKKYKKKEGRFFDCIIGVSGGKDSTRQAMFIKDKLGLKPLLVCMTYPPQQINELGASNISNLIELGFDVLVSGPAPETFRELVKLSFLKFSNWCKSSELALYSSVPQVAIKYEIPLIFNGEDQGQKEINASGTKGWDNNQLRELNTLSGGDINWILNKHYKFKDILPYIYPKEKEFINNNIQIIDLGWFLGDWSFNVNGSYSALNGFKPRQSSPYSTGDPSFVSSLDEDWVPVNQLIKYYKFGYGKATDFINEEIRSGRIDRKLGIEKIIKYDGKCSKKLINSFCKYIDISKKEFWDTVLKSVNKKLFKIESNRKITPKFRVGYGL